MIDWSAIISAVTVILVVGVSHGRLEAKFNIWREEVSRRLDSMEETIMGGNGRFVPRKELEARFDVAHVHRENLEHRLSRLEETQRG